MPEQRAAAVPKVNADKPVGQWDRTMVAALWATELPSCSMARNYSSFLEVDRPSRGALGVGIGRVEVNVPQPIKVEKRREIVADGLLLDSGGPPLFPSAGLPARIITRVPAWF